MMQMTAMESLMDKNMLYLDLVSGVLGAMLSVVVVYGLDNYDYRMVPFLFILNVIIARVIVDFLYSKFVSSTEYFGGSNKEFIISSIVWFILAHLISKVSGYDYSVKYMVIVYLSTLLIMLATARLTHWG